MNEDATWHGPRCYSSTSNATYGDNRLSMGNTHGMLLKISAPKWNSWGSSHHFNGLVIEQKEAYTTQTEWNIKHNQTCSQYTYPVFIFQYTAITTPIIITIIIIIIIIAFKGTISDFLKQLFAISSRVANCLQHVRSSGQGTIVFKSHPNTSGAFLMQHVVCHIVQRDRSLSLTELKSYMF